MSDFVIKRKGYDPKQVDEYINKTTKFSEARLEEQRKRIELLKEENRELQNRIEEYKRQELMVSEALINATKKADEIINASRMRFKLEGERLKLFRDKWTAYVESASNKVYKLDESINMQAYLIKMEDELRDVLGRDLNIKKIRKLTQPEEQFMSERSRLEEKTEKKSGKTQPKSIIEEIQADNNSDYVKKVRESIDKNIRKDIKEANNTDETDDLMEAAEYDITDAIDNDKPLNDILKDLGFI